MTYTTEAKVEAVTQIDIDATTYPTTAQVAVWITEIEAEIAERALGSHTATDQYVDVPSAEESAQYWGFKWTPATDSLQFTYGGAGVIVPLANIKSPFISVTSLAKNDQALNDTPSWSTLTEGPADGSSFILLKSGLKDLGYALYFYDNNPSAGPKRLKLTYTYGFNISSEILGEYCTLQVAVKVLQAKMGTSSASGLTEFEGQDFGRYLPTQYEKRIKSFQIRIKEIETKYFPRKHSLSSVII
uniref:Uncharacterized protein n=1 Tax=viral metagenome TaxID=1070528 RepID=A0A6M3KIP6_9ZZZZ